MESLEAIKEAVRLLDEVENILDESSKGESIYDKKISYILHYLEFESIPLTSSYNILKELKRLRQERRKCKDEMEIIKKYHDIQAKLVNKDNRAMLLVELHKLTKHLDERFYNYNAYTEEEWNKVLGISKN